MNYGRIIDNDVANGEGIRVSLFVSGCRNHCKGCFNEETWDFNYGNLFTDVEVNHILEVLDNPYIEGLTILGGEPFEPENQPEVAKLLQKVRQKYANSKNIWVYTGYLLDSDLQKGGKKHTKWTDFILENVDTIVDGPFIEAKKDLMLRFRGSKNQRIWRKLTPNKRVFTEITASF